ncbi:hypothetical protein ACVH9Z_06495 [Rhodococcus opacus]|uniref:hypothetical protein n=1 Tax=Rhodococcus opacus TaxID=37919 RepID=UPI001B316D61|nr:hypothetical protein [Rhodococcus opacus]
MPPPPGPASPSAAVRGPSWFVVGLAGAILAGFVVGVVLAAVVGRMWPRERVPRVLLLAAVVLAAAGALRAVTTTAPLIGFALALAGRAPGHIPRYRRTAEPVGTSRRAHRGDAASRDT